MGRDKGNESYLSSMARNLEDALNFIDSASTAELSSKSLLSFPFSLVWLVILRML